jgi:hypothetical protein
VRTPIKATAREPSNQAGYKSATSDSTPHLRRAAGSLIAGSLSRPDWCLARVTVLSAVSRCCRNIWSGPEALALQGPQRAYALSRAHRPATQLPAPSPWGDTFVRDAADECRCATLLWPEMPSGTARQIARHCAGLRITCELRLPAPCLAPSAARWLRPNPSGVAIASHDE